MWDRSSWMPQAFNTSGICRFSVLASTAGQPIPQSRHRSYHFLLHIKPECPRDSTLPLVNRDQSSSIHKHNWRFVPYPSHSGWPDWRREIPFPKALNFRKFRNLSWLNMWASSSKLRSIPADASRIPTPLWLFEELNSPRYRNTEIVAFVTLYFTLSALATCTKQDRRGIVPIISLSHSLHFWNCLQIDDSNH